MLIGIDASRYNTRQKTGVEVYSMKIIEGLIELAKRQKKHSLVFYSPTRLPRRCGEPINKPTGEKGHFEIGQRVMPFRRLWTQLRLSWEMRKQPPDLLFVPSHTLPIFRPKKTIITIHDIAFVFFKKAYTPFQYRYLLWSTKFACKHAAKIIVPSQATRDDLCGFFRCDREKVIVIAHGMDFEWKKPPSEKDQRQVLERFGLNEKDKYFFFVGRLESKKNLENVVRAFDEFLKKHDGEFKLVLAGKRGVGFQGIWKTIKELGLEEKVLMPGFVNEMEKDALLMKSRAFIFISLYEGFGFPILEAFRAKIPVITANISAMKEVAGEAALRVNPLDVHEVAAGMHKVVDDEVTRNYMISEGGKRLNDFKWVDCSEKTWEVLKEEVESP